MKASVKLLVLVVLIGLVAGCAATPTKAPPAEVEETPVPELTAAEQWAQANGVGPYQAAEEDWPAIEAAAKEEGKVVVYSNSSKIEKLIEPFQEMYPGIELAGGDTDEIAIKMSSEQKSGNVVGDVWFQSYGHVLYGEFMPNQWLWSYVSPGVEFSFEVNEERPFAIQRRSVDVIGYNQEINPDGCPLTNWWELTEPALQGKFYMEDPIADGSTTAKVTLIIQYADEFADAYQKHYGKDWTTDEAYGEDTPNAGYLYLKKLAKNQPGIQPGGDEVDAAFATLGMDPATEPGYGWTGFSSYEDTLDGELAMAPCYDLEPRVGILKAGYLGIATNAPHPNAAKLFIKFALSQTGFKPWSAIGTYPPVVGVEVPEGMPALDDIALWPSDDVFAYKNLSQVRDFWAVNYLTP
ncbi:MAG TPA: extracellular solute-binding protein [Anaerolineae bacterium]|nr:extracellular solute-binding protein [Anaerolineae bacterium]